MGSPAIHAPPARNVDDQGVRSPARRRMLAAGALCVLLAAVAAWWIRGSDARALRSAERLLAEAYSEQRPFEIRLSPSAYAPVQSRKAQSASVFTRPIALGAAESLIARRLAAHPDHPAWLRLRAHAELLGEDYDAAVSTLRRATDTQPDDVTLLGDLGAAFAVRAAAKHQEIDYGAAIEKLWQFLRARPDSPLALFNRAIVYERMFLMEDARKDWEHYLKLDPAGGWASIARERKQAIERKVDERNRALQGLASASGYLLALKDARAYDAEFYLDAAVTDWLPASASDPAAREALTNLARLLKENHQDGWLADLLKAKPDAHYREANLRLAAAVKQNLAEDHESALNESRQAQQIYRASGVRAGELLAKYEEVSALYRSTRAAECLARAEPLVKEAASLHYGWVELQARMAAGNCGVAGGNEGRGRAEFQRALAGARATGFKTLELSALGLLDGNATTSGSQLAAWQQVAERLATCWEAPHRRSRAFQFYSNLSKASAALDYPYAAFVFRSAAAEEISRTSSQVLPAQTHAVIAGLADAAGLHDEGEQEFRKAAELFARAHPTPSLHQKRLAAEVARAESIVRRNPQAALQQIQRVWSAGEPFPSNDTELNYFQAKGHAELLLGNLKGAEADYQRAIDCNERKIGSVRSGADRGAPLSKTEDAYRGLAYISLGRNPTQAFNLWEWYRSADLAGSRRKLDSLAALPHLASEVVLSYFLLQDGKFHVWVLRDGKTESVRLAVSKEQLDPVVSRFLRQCADPQSPLAALRRDARQLYDWLIAPVADRLSSGRVLVVEPDGPIGALPLQALMDPGGHYLGERLPIVISRGLVSYEEKARLKSVTNQSRALVMANPALGDELAKTFPPLEDAEREGRYVAAMFPDTKLLSGTASTAEALESHVSDAEVFHFAGHGLSADGRVGLLLAGSPDREPSGRLLTSAKLLSQDWSLCSLVVLSACSTGTGERNGFVNPESLVRAFLNAGAGRVVASRWTVESAVAAGFMRQFYQAVIGGALPSSALRESAETLRSSPITAHPYYWAAFQLFGYK